MEGTIQLDGETARPAQVSSRVRAPKAGNTLGEPPKVPTVSARRASIVISTIGPRWGGGPGARRPQPGARAPRAVAKARNKGTAQCFRSKKARLHPGRKVPELR